MRAGDEPLGALAAWNEGAGRAALRTTGLGREDCILIWGVLPATDRAGLALRTGAERRSAPALLAPVAIAAPNTMHATVVHI
jgi:hypothetical protein